MLLYFYLIFFLYFLFVWFLRKGWALVSEFQDTPVSDYFVSVIVVVRNEEKNIRQLLVSIATQTYPHDKFELILIDDQSEDRTRLIIQEFMSEATFKIRLIDRMTVPEQNMSPKMSALNAAIAEARGEIIVTTDGDCHVGKNWLKIIAAPFRHEKIQFVSGPVALDGSHGLFSKIQSMEFASLIGSGAALIGWRYPLMCNGANLAYRKKAFMEVNGFEGVYKSVSGDDVFLMQKIHKRFDASIGFAGSCEALVFTRPQETFSNLLHQRKRWASKWKRHLLPFSWAIPVFLFIHYLSFATLIVYSFGEPGVMIHGFLLIILKFVFDYIFLKRVMDFCRLPMNIWVFLITEFIYPFYALFIGILVHFGGWNWKGRKYV
jgi:cellulose synthase/poly-beta-1,6-N-acetylglucosamine synthase-like glycosyltransferase